MNEVMKKLQEVYDLLTAIPVQGQHVDVMHNVRVKLRIAYQLAEKKAEEEKKAEAEKLPKEEPQPEEVTQDG